MQNQPRYSVMRRLLFPYSGEVPLTRLQGIRVIITWALFFAFVMSFCSMPVLLVEAKALSPQKVVLLLFFTLLTGAFVFGALAWVVVSMSNRAARFRQRREAASTGSTSGGRYGS